MNKIFFKVFTCFLYFVLLHFHLPLPTGQNIDKFVTTSICFKLQRAFHCPVTSDLLLDLLPIAPAWS